LKACVFGFALRADFFDTGQVLEAFIKKSCCKSSTTYVERRIGGDNYVNKRNRTIVFQTSEETYDEKLCRYLRLPIFRRVDEVNNMNQEQIYTEIERYPREVANLAVEAGIIDEIEENMLENYLWQTMDMGVN